MSVPIFDAMYEMRDISNPGQLPANVDPNLGYAYTFMIIVGLIFGNITVLASGGYACIFALASPMVVGDAIIYFRRGLTLPVCCLFWTTSCAYFSVVLMIEMFHADNLVLLWLLRIFAWSLTLAYGTGMLLILYFRTSIMNMLANKTVGHSKKFGGKSELEYLRQTTIQSKAVHK